MFNIDSFIANTGAFVKSNRYLLTIGQTGPILGASSVTLPSRTIQTRPDNSYIVGRTLKTPYATDITTLSITLSTNYMGGLILPTDNLIYFESWMAGTNTNSIIYNKPDGHSNQAINFFSNFASEDITLQQFDETGQLINTWVMFKAFPESISYGAFSYKDKDTIHEITVTFDVEDYVSINADGGDSLGSVFGSSFGNGGLSGLFGSGFSLDRVSGLVGNALKDKDPWDVEGNWDQNFNEKSFLDQVKDTYTSAKSGAAGFLKEIGDVADPRITSAAKDIAKTAVRNAINGQPTDFGRLAKQKAAPQIGKIAGSVFDDPAVKRQANQAAQAVIYGQDKRLTNVGKDTMVKQIFDIIGK
jgi:hypothetical protein